MIENHAHDEGKNAKRDLEPNHQVGASRNLAQHLEDGSPNLAKPDEEGKLCQESKHSVERNDASSAFLGMWASGQNGQPIKSHRKLNVNEYAERVLLSTDLSEKLRLGNTPVFFDQSRFSIEKDFLPGRPDCLKLEKDAKASRVPLPARPALVDDKSRGTLLHFFANHELLAAELMALALLKFPDAPVEFRKGLFETLKEEQKHTLWYLGRMNECGVELGEFPVSRFFWDTVSTMETPFDYVARLSLTFEQANLDYSRHFGEIMAEAGDRRTARILGKIYRDEIRHVGYGLKWFRTWKSPSQSDWEAYQKSLALPLSPSRAKGNGTHFNEEGRFECGLDEDFIRSLGVYEKSKGRTPNVFFFNPDAEDEIAAAEGKGSYQPNKKVQSLVNDLEILLIFLARQDDVVLLRNLPSLSHLRSLRELGFTLPQFEALSADRSLPDDSDFPTRKLNALRPWSAAPSVSALLHDLCSNANNEVPLWKKDWSALFSKTEQAGAFSEFWGTSLTSGDPEEIAAFATRHGKIVVKRPISAAGRGVKVFDDPELTKKQALLCLQNDPDLLAEPYHDRVFDFSVQYQIAADGIRKTRLDQTDRRSRWAVPRQHFFAEILQRVARFSGSFCDGRLSAPASTNPVILPEKS